MKLRPSNATVGSFSLSAQSGKTKTLTFLSRMRGQKTGLMTAFMAFLAVLLIVVAFTAKAILAKAVPTEEEIVRQLLEEVPLIDGHNDLPYQFYDPVGNHLDQLDLNSDLTNTTHTDIPRMRAGGMGGVFFVAYSNCKSQYRDAVEMALTQIDVIKRLTNKYNESLKFATSDLEILNNFRDGKMSVLIGLEGGHMIKSNLAILRVMYDAGVRYMTLTHNCNTPWADAAYSDELIPETKHDDVKFEPTSNGISDFGKDVILEMNRLGMMVDLSHVSESSMVSALNISRAPVIFSHSSAFAMCNHRRNVKDHVLKKLKENNGVIMVNFWNNVLLCDESHVNATIDNAVIHLNYLRNLIGIDHLGLGADYDGVDLVPIGLEDVSTYPRLLAMLLRDPNWSKDDIKQLAGGNILRVMADVDKVRREMIGQTPDDQTLLFEKQLKDNAGAQECRTLRDFTKEEREKEED